MLTGIGGRDLGYIYTQSVTNEQQNHLLGLLFAGGFSRYVRLVVGKRLKGVKSQGENVTDS